MSSSAAPKPIGRTGEALELRSAVDNAEAKAKNYFCYVFLLSVCQQVKLDPKWVLDLRSIRVQKKIGIGGYAEVWKALWKEKVFIFFLCFVFSEFVSGCGL